MKNYIKELRKTMTEKKRREAKNDFFAFYIGRPLSYVLTVPFIVFNVTPNAVTIISLIEVIIASIVLATARNIYIAILGVFLFFLWNLLDGVDGNIARLKKISTPMGSVFDAMSGYAAMFLTFFAAGIYAGNMESNSYQIIIGSISGMSLIFPRLIMHKAKNELEVNTSSLKSIESKAEYSLYKVIALNLTSISGIVQPILLFSVIFGKIEIFNFIYLAINVIVMVISIYKILIVQ